MQISKNVIELIKISEAIKFENLVFHPIHFENKQGSIVLKTLDDLFDEKKVQHSLRLLVLLPISELLILYKII